MNAFLTGSRIYGTVKPGSDVDLVLLVDEDTKQKLVALSDLGKEPVRFGKLNLILCTMEEEFAVWKVGTAQMKLRKSRDKVAYSSQEAKQCLDVLRQMVGVDDEGQSGGG